MPSSATLLKGPMSYYRRWPSLPGPPPIAIQVSGSLQAASLRLAPNVGSAPARSLSLQNAKREPDEANLKQRRR
jgi:hypothetical protein